MMAMMVMMALNQMRKRLADMGMYRQRPGNRGRQGARAADRAEGAAVASERRNAGAGHERRTMDDGRCPEARAAEAATSPHAAAGKGRVRNEQRSARQRQGGQTDKFLQHRGLRCGTKSRRTRF